jgi:putative endonuclease
MAKTYSVYILSNRSRTLYVGVTSDLTRRLHQHRTATGSRFARRYALGRLVYVECAPRAADAIAREKQIKRWSRHKKVTLVEETNPHWTDLAADWA